MNLLRVRNDLATALQLAGNALRLIDKEDHDVEHRLAEMDGVRRIDEIAAQGDHLIVEHLETLDLHLGARVTVEDGAVLLVRLEQLAHEDAHHLAIPHHAAARALMARAAGESSKRADDDGIRPGDVAGFPDEISVRALARAGGAAEEDKLLGETQVLAPILSVRGPSRRC